MLVPLIVAVEYRTHVSWYFRVLIAIHSCLILIRALILSLGIIHGIS
jgi:hypothetical protein